MNYRLSINIQAPHDDADIRGLMAHCMEMIFGLYILSHTGAKESIKTYVKYIDDDEEEADIIVEFDNIVKDDKSDMYKLATGVLVREEIESNKSLYDYIESIEMEDLSTHDKSTIL